MLKTFTEVRHGAESEQRQALCNNSETFYWWSSSTLVWFHTKSTAADSQTKQAGWNLIDPHITHSSISPPLLHIENITLYFTRGLREQNIYYLTRNSVQAKYVQQTWSRRPKALSTYEYKRVSRPTPNTLAAAKNVTWIQNGPTWASFGFLQDHFTASCSEEGAGHAFLFFFVCSWRLEGVWTGQMSGWMLCPPFWDQIFIHLTVYLH